MPLSFWQQCLEKLQTEYTTQQFNTWLRPLQVEARQNILVLLAPNRFVVTWVEQNFLEKIKYYVSELGTNTFTDVVLEVGTKKADGDVVNAENLATDNKSFAAMDEPSMPSMMIAGRSVVTGTDKNKKTNLNQQFTFDSFVEGKSNQLARAASQRVAEEPGRAYNPLFIYGGVGLGKTHLMHAIGNMILQKKSKCKNTLFTFRTFCR